MCFLPLGALDAKVLQQPGLKTDTLAAAQQWDRWGGEGADRRAIQCGAACSTRRRLSVWSRRMRYQSSLGLVEAAVLVALAQQLWHLRNIRAAPACEGAPQYGRRARGGCSPCTLTARAGAHRAALGLGWARSCSRQRCARRGENRFQRQPAKPPTFVRAVVGKRISRIRLQEGY